MVKGADKVDVISECGRVYTWGRGDYGQLGRPLPTRMEYRPTVLEISGVPRQVVLGSEHNLLLDGQSLCPALTVLSFF